MSCTNTVMFAQMSVLILQVNYQSASPKTLTHKVPCFSVCQGNLLYRIIIQRTSYFIKSFWYHFFSRRFPIYWYLQELHRVIIKMLVGFYIGPPVQMQGDRSLIKHIDLPVINSNIYLQKHRSVSDGLAANIKGSYGCQRFHRFNWLQ